jgi:hypothetical protein
VKKYGKNILQAAVIRLQCLQSVKNIEKTRKINSRLHGLDFASGST